MIKIKRINKLNNVSLGITISCFIVNAALDLSFRKISSKLIKPIFQRTKNKNSRQKPFLVIQKYKKKWVKNNFICFLPILLIKNIDLFSIMKFNFGYQCIFLLGVLFYLRVFFFFHNTYTIYHPHNHN